MAPTAQDAFNAAFGDAPDTLEVYLRKLAQYQAHGFDTQQFHADLNSGDESQFHQQVWEMMLGCHLLDLGLDVQAPPINAPDYLVQHGGRRIWIEATSPKPTGIPVETLQPPSWPPKVRTRPNNEILLRWTASIAEKHRKLLKYIKDGVVRPGESYVIAVHGGQLAWWPHLVH